MLNFIKKLYVPIMILVIIMALVFLPEILGLKDKATSVTSSDSFNTTESFTNEGDFQEPVHFTKILGGLSANRGSKKEEEVKVKTYDQKLISWDFLKSSKIKSYIGSRLKDLKKLEAEFPADYQESKSALTLFIISLENLYKPENLKNYATDVVRSLEKNEMSVSIKMLREYIPRSILIRWSKIDLSYLYQSQRAVNYKLLAASHFDPKFQIFNAQYYFNEDRKNKLLKLNELEVTFVLDPETVKKIEVYKDGIFYSKLSIKNDLITKRWNRAVFKVKEISSVYSFYIEDILGNKVIKNYIFDRNQNNLRLVTLTEKSNKNAIVYSAPLKLNLQNQTNLIDALYSFQPRFDREFFSGEAEFSF